MSKTAKRRPLHSARGFLASCVCELQRTEWPSGRSTLQLAVVVAVFVALIGAYLALVNLGFEHLAQRLL